MNKRFPHTFIYWFKVFWIIELLSIILVLIGYQYLDKNGMIFQNPEALYLLFLLPFLYLLFIKRLYDQTQLFENSPQLLTTGDKSYLRIFNLKFILLKNIFFSLIIALSNPIYGTKKVDVISKDGEIMICLDISNSMNVKDIGDESRLEVSKRILNGIVNKLAGQKVGICLFAADGFVQIPPTRDYQSIKVLLSDVETTYLSRQGTNIAEALKLAMGSFSKGKVPKSILLITDGENHMTENKSIYELIKKNKVLLIAMGIGSETGGPVPDILNSTLKFDQNGKLVISKLNVEFVQKLAAQSNGKFMRIDSPYPNLSSLLTEINLRSKGYFRNLKVEVKQSLVEYPVYFGFVFFMLFLIIPVLKLFKK